MKLFPAIFVVSAAVVFAAGCTKESFPVESRTVKTSSQIPLPEGFENWPRTVYVFDKTKCVDMFSVPNASEMKVNAGAGYTVAVVVYKTSDNLLLTPSEAGSESFKYKVTARDFNLPLPQIWSGTAVLHGNDGDKLEIEFSPVTSVVDVDVKSVPANLDSLTFDIPTTCDVLYPWANKTEVSIPGNVCKHVVLDTRGKESVSFSSGIMPMRDPDKSCMVSVNCYYAKGKSDSRYSTGFLPFNRGIGQAQKFNIELENAKGGFFDSPFSVRYELSDLSGETIGTGRDYLSQWDYSYDDIVLPADTTKFYVRADGRKMSAGRSFAYQFGSVSSGFFDSKVKFAWSEDPYVISAPIYAENGFDHIRIPVDEGYCFFSNGEAKPDFKTELKRLVDCILDNGMRVIIDYHWMASGLHVMPSSTNAYSALPSEQEIRFRNTWRQLHEMFKDYAPEDLAYEIVNESYCDYGWNLFLERAIHMMRSWGGNELRRVIFCPCESEGDGAISHLKNLELPKGDPNLVISFHDYSPDQLSFYYPFDGGYGGPIHYPGQLVLDSELEEMELTHPEWYEQAVWFYKDSWDKVRLLSHFTPAAEASKRLGCPIWLGEYGVQVHAPYNDRLRFYQDACSSFRSLGISYSFWFEICKTADEWTMNPDPQIMLAMVPRPED